MANNWSREEVEAVVADYFAMLYLERSGIAFNKSERRRALGKVLNGRTDDSISMKCSNISAVLQELGMPIVEGYGPLPNYQGLLFDVIESQSNRAKDLHTVLIAEASGAAIVPTVADILTALVDPPKTAKAKASTYPGRVGNRPQIRSAVDYPAIEAANRSLGGAGEEFTVRFEQARLLAARRDNLASAVERVSITKGDGLGYDVLSFDDDGRERFIEVKTTAYGPATPFLVTRNEVSISHALYKQYHLYRVFDFRRQPKLFQMAGQIDQAFSLDAVQFMARLRAS